ncbi:Arm DNA-binding domain-containing protein [Legionella sp. 31fI33]|nr:Arm DNA-binding domain-containing protein [Legionella sp. 31fI33]
MTLGHYPELTAEMAKNKVQHLLGQIAMGIDPAKANGTCDKKFGGSFHST